MAGISSRAAGSLENKYKFGGKELQHQEFSDGSGLEWMDFGPRMMDGQTGRTNQQDPHAENRVGLSPYAMMGNSPVNRVDPTGMDDWAKNSDGSFTYDPNLTKDNAPTQLQKGQTYVGTAATVTSGTKNADGSVNPDTQHQLNSNGTVTDLKTGAISSDGQSVTTAAGNQITSYQAPNKPGDFGMGFSLSAGLGLFLQGAQVSIGGFGKPGTVSQGFISIGWPSSPVYVDASASAQVLFGYSTNGKKIDVGGAGRTYGIATPWVGGSYSTDDPQSATNPSPYSLENPKTPPVFAPNPNYRIFGAGLSVGAEYTGGGMETRTFTWPAYWPITLGGVRY